MTIEINKSTSNSNKYSNISYIKYRIRCLHRIYRTNNWNPIFSIFK